MPEWPRESKAFHYFRHLGRQGDRPNVVSNRLDRHLFRQGAQLRVSEKEVQRLHTKRYYTYQQLNPLREFKCELLEYYIMYAIWSWRFLDFCLPQGDIGFAHSDKKIGGIAIPQNETSLGTCSFSLDV